MTDVDDRAWWTFRIITGAGSPGSTVHVPADTEAEARAALLANLYSGADVHTFPCLGSRWTTRDQLKKEALRS